MEGQTEFVTKRSSDFSIESTVKEKPFGLDEVQIYDLITNNQETSEAFWQGLPTMSEEKKAEQLAQLQACQEYIAIPTVMKDANSAYIGVPYDRIPEFRRLGYTRVPDSRIKIVLASILERSRPHP